MYNSVDDNIFLCIVKFQVLLNSDLYRGLKYNQATPVFHQWRDSSRQVYGIKFNYQEEADGFAEVVRIVLESLQSMCIVYMLLQVHVIFEYIVLF